MNEHLKDEQPDYILPFSIHEALERLFGQTDEGGLIPLYKDHKEKGRVIVLFKSHGEHTHLELRWHYRDYPNK